MTQKKQILIVEDNEFNRAMLSEILSHEYQVLEAENGQEALDILKCPTLSRQFFDKFIVRC